MIAENFLIIEPRRGMAHQQIERVVAELLRQPRAPFRLDAIARLQYRRGAAPLPTRNQSGMTALRRCQQRHHRGIFAVRPRREHNSFVGPFHK